MRRPRTACRSMRPARGDRPRRRHSWRATAGSGGGSEMPDLRGGPDLLSGAARSVAIRAIEQELASFWQAAGVPEHGHGPVMTARVLNLIAVITNPAGAGRIAQTLGRLVYRYPCRAIVVTAEPDAPGAGLETWI